MEISKENFLEKCQTQGLTLEQGEKLWLSLSNRPLNTPGTKLTYYLGSIIVIMAMTIFLGMSWNKFGALGITLISLSYSVILILFAARLSKKDDLKLIGGLLATIAVSILPIAVYGIERMLGTMPELSADYNASVRQIQGNYIFMELAVIIGSLAALKYFSFPFLTAPLFFASFCLIFSLIPFLFGTQVSQTLFSWITIAFGTLLILIGAIEDKKRKYDYGFWPYFFGTFALSIGLLTLLVNNSELQYFILLLCSLALLYLSLTLNRRVLAVFGAMGVFYYFCHLADTFFADTIWFPIAISLIGFATIFAGYLYQKYLLKPKD